MTVLCIYEKSGRNSELIVDAKDIYAVTADYSILEYYENDKLKKAKIDIKANEMMATRHTARDARRTFFFVSFIAFFSWNLINYNYCYYITAVY